MAPAAGTPKGVFKTYEGQARLLRAIIAAHPEVKWDHKSTYFTIHFLITTSLHTRFN
jgi:hypothetical protein